MVRNPTYNSGSIKDYFRTPVDDQETSVKHHKNDLGLVCTGSFVCGPNVSLSMSVPAEVKIKYDSHVLHWGEEFVLARSLYTHCTAEEAAQDHRQRPTNQIKSPHTGGIEQKDSIAGGLRETAAVLPAWNILERFLKKKIWVKIWVRLPAAFWFLRHIYRDFAWYLLMLC